MPVIFANPLQPLVDFAEGILVFFHDDVGVGWGVSIILLTVAVRLALLPLTIRQFRSMQGLQRLAPEMKVLQEKYKDDRQRQQQEMMKLYREHKVNPLGSCLPLLLQLPVFLALFYMLRQDLRYDICPNINPPVDTTPEACGKATDAAGFLFIPDLTNKATGAVLVALIVLYVGSQLASSLLMSVSADPTQRRIMILLPLIFVAFILSFPAGLIVYWITTNLWTIGQQWFVRRTVGPLRPAAATAGAGDGGGKGGRAAKGTPATSPRAAPPPPPRKRKKRSGRRR